MEIRRLAALSSTERASLLERDAGIDEIRKKVSRIVDRVREEGDQALRAFARDLDGVDLDVVEITDTLDGAAKRVDDRVLEAIRVASDNIRAFHEQQRRDDWYETVDGRRLGRRFRPLEHVGVYVPGGTAAYPSSALMGVIPAKVAGVDEVSVATPPAEDPNPATLAALVEAGVDRVYAIGGAQAIAALAYGTETVDPVQKIVGPGNRWVTAAKAAVRGTVEIDFLAGPSELLVLADETANPTFVAADLLAQAEHDADSAVVVVTNDQTTATAIVEAIDRRINENDRAGVIGDALASDSSGIFVAESMSVAAGFAEAYAPEHLSLQTEDAETLLDTIESAGSVFIGPFTPVAAGDYATGTNHVLPTGGAAKVTGGLSVDTFLRATTVQRLDREALAELRETATTLAHTEGLEAHAESIEERFRS